MIQFSKIMIPQIWFQNRQNNEKIVSMQETKVQNVVFNAKGRIHLLFYYVKHIHGQFKTYFKTPKHSLQTKLLLGKILS
jgi:exonuclease III